jgi:hypothetical protein
LKKINAAAQMLPMALRLTSRDDGNIRQENRDDSKHQQHWHVPELTQQAGCRVRLI